MKEEQIRRLKYEAMDILALQPSEEYHPFTISKTFEEVYAELIVRECIKLVEPSNNHQAWPQGYVAGVAGLELLDHKVAVIKQHFGVE